MTKSLLADQSRTDINSSIKVNHLRGWLAYECLGRAMEQFPQYSGYFYINDDMIVNWWKFIHLDRNKIWISSNIERQVEIGKPIDPKYWHGLVKKQIMVWKNVLTLSKQCEHLLVPNEIPWLNSSFTNYVNNNNGKPICRHGWSDLFFVPKRLAAKFQTTFKYILQTQSFSGNCCAQYAHLSRQYKQF